MEKIIWVLDNDKKNMYNVQRSINSTGSMKAYCIFMYEALEKIINDVAKQEYSNTPALIVINWEMSKQEEFKSFRKIKSEKYISGVPIFFIISEKDERVEEECYKLGAVGVISGQMGRIDIQRLEIMAWQFETAKSMEHKIEKQSNELAMAREIKKLNKQLADRNELLYKVFGRYFSDEVMSQILERKELASIGGEKKEMTVMLSDLRGFTALSQAMEPDKMMDLLNYYFSKMVDIINEYKGTVIEFLGDGILAVFGAPIHYEMHTDNAVAAAINMQNAMIEVDEYCLQKGHQLLNMGIGIHCGEVFIGNIGSEKLMRYNVIGSVVNECSRIESYSVGGQIYISDIALKNMRSSYKTKDEKNITVKGLEKPLKIWDICGIKGEYQSEINQRKKMPMYALDKDLDILIYEIHNKMISEEAIKGKLKRISIQEAEINVYEGVLSCLNDVKIVGADENGDIVFDNVYGKIMEKSETGCRVNFTYINDTIKKFVIENRRREPMTMVYDEFAIKCSENDLETGQYKYQLSFSQRYDEADIVVTSTSKEIRAIEILDYLIPEFALIRGDAASAKGVISISVLNAMMLDEDIKDIEKFFEKRVKQYYDECQWIYSKEYSKENEESIKSLPRYKKRNSGWAFVRTTDLAEIGQEIYLKTLENESGEIISVAEDVYIMIGYRGELYTISAEKFHKTYEASDEKIDVIEQMMEFLPEVMIYPQGDYMSIEEKAYICNPKTGLEIYAKEIDCRTKIFGKYINGEYFLGRPGDYMAIRCDDIEDMYIIRKDVFETSYEEV